MMEEKEEKNEQSMLERIKEHFCNFKFCFKTNPVVLETVTEEERQDRINEILNFKNPNSIKIRGFEEVSEQHKKIKEETILPIRGSKQSAGYDFHSKETVVIKPGKTHLFWTDVKAYMMPGEVLEMYVRSSIGIKKGLVLSNGTGIIDMDYFSNFSNDGNIGVCLHNMSDKAQTIEAGERIAQGIFKSFLTADNGGSNEDRTGGIGSTNN